MGGEKKHHGSWWSRIGFLLVVMILVGNSWMIWQMRAVVERVDKYNQGVVDEIGGVTGDLKTFADDLNEIRRFLLLPEKDYAVNGETGVISEVEISPEVENNMAVFAMLDSFAREKKVEEKKVVVRGILDGLVQNGDLLKAIGAANLRVGERQDLQVKFTDGTGQALFGLVYDAEADLFRMQGALGEQTFGDYRNADFTARITDYLVKNAQAAREAKVAKLKQEEIDRQKATEAGVQELQNRKVGLDNMVKDKAFVDTLAGLGWQVAGGAREEANKYIYDVKDASGIVVFSLAVEVSSGMIKVLRDGQEIDVKSFLSDDGSKKKP